MWTWIAIGVAGFLVFATAVALVVAGTLGAIADQISELHETEDWAALPLTREAETQIDAERGEVVLSENRATVRRA